MWLPLSAFQPLLSCELYSGTSSSRDACCRGLVYLYDFGPSYGDATTTVCDGKMLGGDTCNLFDLNNRRPAIRLCKSRQSPLCVRILWRFLHDCFPQFEWSAVVWGRSDLVRIPAFPDCREPHSRALVSDLYAGTTQTVLSDSANSSLLPRQLGGRRPDRDGSRGRGLSHYESGVVPGYRFPSRRRCSAHDRGRCLRIP